MMDWVKEMNGAITVCDENFIIVDMNDRSIEEFKKYGGKELIGQNLLECHNPQSKAMLKELMKTGNSHSYQRTKSDGRVKVIHQTPWREKGKIKGLVEISFYLE